MKDVGTNKSSLKLVLAVLVLAVIGLSVGIWFVVQNNKQDDEVVTKDEGQGQVDEDIEYSGKLTAEDYMEWIDEKISNTADLAEKANLCMTGAIQLSNLQAQDNVDYSKKILEYAYMAEDVYPSAQSAYAIYEFEYEFGDKDIAEKYLNVAKERGYEEVPING